MKLSRFYPYQFSGAAHATEIAAQSVSWGIPAVWFPQSLTVSTELCLAAAARAVPGCYLGTAVSLMQWRHPLDMALVARSLADVTGDRFSLGLGVSEPAAVSNGLGLEYGSAIQYAREYLQVLVAGIAGGSIALAGTRFHVDAYLPHGNWHPSVLLGALGPRMAEVAGQFADGCITWLVPLDYLAGTLICRIKACGAADRERRVVALVPFIPTEDAGEVEETLAHVVRGHLNRPHYKRMLARAGLPAQASLDSTLRALRDQVVLWGTIDQIGSQIRAYASAGVDELAAAIYPTGAAEASEQAHILVEIWNQVARQPNPSDSLVHATRN